MNRSSLSLLVLFILTGLFVLPSFTSAETQQPPTDEMIVRQADIAYLAADRAEKLDAYLPPDSFSGPHPAVLLIHGGGWRLGDKADAREREIGRTLASHGYAVFSINYLLNDSKREGNGPVVHTRVVWPRNLEDCEAALHWLQTEAVARYHVDPTRLAVMGGSAGGHLSLLLGATHPDKIRAIISLYGIGDLNEPHVQSLASAFAGTTPEETAVRLAAASPLARIDAHTPPLFLAHGTADKIVPIEHARWLTRELQKRGATYWYVEIAGAPHTFDLEPPQMDLRPTVLSFLEKHLGRPHRKDKP